MLELDNPLIDGVRLGETMGVPDQTVSTAEVFHAELKKAMGRKGPKLIEATFTLHLQPVMELILQQCKVD